MSSLVRRRARQRTLRADVGSRRVRVARIGQPKIAIEHGETGEAATRVGIIGIHRESRL